MKLYIFLLCCSIGLAQATNSYAQKATVSLNMQNQTVQSVLDEIENQSEFSFFFNTRHVDLNRRVSVNTKNSNVFKVLDNVFAGTNVRYSVVDKKIILSTESVSVPDVQQQNKKTVSGIVKDENGEPIIGANVVEKGTTNGTVTDMDGKYTLTVTLGGSLQISYIGFNEQVIKVGKESLINITLHEDTQSLDEVVVVGYGTVKKGNLTNAVTSVKADVLENRPVSSVADALQGQVPGLSIVQSGRPGEASSMQLRGATSLNSGGSPLLLVDGIPTDTENFNYLNVEDIESVSVLKDAASAAIYGARAAGGVILITTKRPKGGTSFQLNYNNNFAFSNAINLPKQAPLMDYLQAYSDAAGDQFWTPGAPSVSRWMELLKQYQQDPSSLQTMGDGIYKDTDGSLYYMNEKDLVKNMLETSFQMTHNISATGGTDKLRYRLSAGYLSNDGILVTNKDKYDRMNVSSFVSADITSWFTQEATLSYAHSKKTLPASALGGIYSTRLASFYPEGVCPEGADDLGGEGLPYFTPRNQVEWSNPSKTINDNPRIFFKSILKPLKGLEIAFEYTFDKNIYDYHWYTGSVPYTTIQGGKDVTPTNDYLRKYKQYTDYNAFNLYGTYDFSLGDHRFKVMAGFNQESKYKETLDAYSYGQAITDIPAMGSGTSTIKVNDSYDEFAVRGGFFRVNYNYRDKYLLEVNGRYDGSSKFPKENRFGFFPSVSVGWQIAQEKFMEATRDWLGGLKIRASYGEIGNQNVPSYSYTPTMELNNKYNGWLSGSDFVTAISSLPALVSNSFTWEKVGTLDFGLDISLLNNRLNGTFDWYQRDTKGMLAPGMQLPGVVGASAPYQNTADMRTTGWELNLNWRDQIGKVSYRVGFNLSDSKSKIMKYNSNESKILTSTLSNGNTFWNYYEGKEIGEIWGYEANGFYTVDDFESTSSWILKDGITALEGYSPRPGDLKFKNLRDEEGKENIITSGNNTVDNPGDRKVIGNNMPRYLYGINLGASYGGFDLNIFLQGTGKRDAWIANTLNMPLYADFKFVPLYDDLSNYWKPADLAAGDYTCSNPNAEFPRVYGNYGNQGSNYRQSDKFLSDASYLRIKNVTLSYTVPKAWVSKLTLKQLKAFVSIENLATFSSLPKGIDPETLNWNYPASRTVSFGINLTL